MPFPPNAPTESRFPADTVRRAVKIVIGYGVALAAGLAYVFYRQMVVTQEQLQASGGMYAFGDALGFCFITGLVGLLPTLWLFQLVRWVKVIWIPASWLMLFLGVTAPIAYLFHKFGLPQTTANMPSSLKIAGLLATLRLFCTAVFFAFNLLAAWVTPRGDVKTRFRFSALLEGSALALCLMEFFKNGLVNRLS